MIKFEQNVNPETHKTNVKKKLTNLNTLEIVWTHELSKVKPKFDEPRKPRECVNPQNWTTQSEKSTNPNNLQNAQTHKTEQHKAKIDEPRQECVNCKTKQREAKY